MVVASRVPEIFHLLDMGNLIDTDGKYDIFLFSVSKDPNLINR